MKSQDHHMKTNQQNCIAHTQELSMHADSVSTGKTEKRVHFAGEHFVDSVMVQLKAW